METNINTGIALHTHVFASKGHVGLRLTDKLKQMKNAKYI